MNRPVCALDFSLLSFLIIDDQPFTRRLVRSILLGFGSREIYESANGAEALELVRTATPSMIITDLVMPVINGLRFVSALKTPPSPAHKIPIIVLSGYLTKTATLAVRCSGADEFLVKPVSPKTLYTHISRIVMRSDPASRPIAHLQQQKRRIDRKRTDDVAFL